MKLSKYFEVVKPQYIYLKLTPNNSVRNNNTDQIAKAICSLYKNLTQCINRYEKKFFYEPKSKVAYYIYIEKSKAEFYFIINKTYLQLIKEKIQNSWKGLTIKEVEEMPNFSDKADKFYMTYKKEDGLSLSVDKRSNSLLSSLLNVVPVMKEGDKVGIFYNFIPCSQYSWRATYDKTIHKLKDGMPIDRQKTGGMFIVKMLGYIITFILEMIENAIFDLAKVDKKEDSLSDLFFEKLNMKELSTSTQRKKELNVLDTQIVVLSDSPDRKRKMNNARAITTAYNRITGDNELVARRYKKNFEPQDLYFRKAETIKCSTDECQNFIQLPGRDLLEEHNCIEKIETQETQVPEPLRQGVMCVGTNTYRGIKQRGFLSTDSEYKNLTLVVIGPTRAGKTNFIANISKNAVDNNECMILFDFCGNNELSNEVSSVFPNSQVLSIECDDIDNLQGLGYNEVPRGKSTFEQYRNAKRQTSQLVTLINSINADDKKLAPRMDRFLKSAALIVFINNGAINDVFDVIQNHRKRYDYIKKIPKDQMDNLEEYILSLEELDDTSTVTEETEKDGKKVKIKKEVVTGTRISKISGIIDRIDRLKDNTYLEMMLKQDCSNNIDLVKEIQKNQVICIKMPEHMFLTEKEKDIYSTYWITKVWLALQIRKWQIPDKKQRKKVNVVVDELYQVPYTQDFIRKKLSQMAKFSCKIIISCHHLSQIGIIREELKSANASYMLISGCDKKNYNELKEELHPYTLDDLLNLPRFHSLNLIKYTKGYAKFITHLPTDIIIET